MGQKKGGRGAGGRRHMVTSAEDLEKRNEKQEIYQRSRAARRGENGEGGEGSGDDEDKDEDEDKAAKVDEEARTLQMDALRAEVGIMSGEPTERKKKGVQGLIATANLNAGKSHTKSIKASAMGEGGGEAPELTRREREEIEKQRSAEAYRKKHAEGKTDEYKVDMARLAEARKRREELEAQKKAEKVANKAEARAPVERNDGGGDDSDDEDLDARKAKTLKPPQLKEQLKKRGLSTQGQKKELLARLIEAL